MNTNHVELTHAPSHLRAEFQDLLDSYEPDRLKELDIQPVTTLLDALSTCGDILPAGYCDQLEIPKGSTYAQAVADVRRFYADRKQLRELSSQTSVCVPSQDPDYDPVLKCRECGCNQFDVVRKFVQLSHANAYLPCTCGAAKDALVEAHCFKNRFEQHGCLDDSHRLTFTPPKDCGLLDIEVGKKEVTCPTCAEGGDAWEWHIVSEEMSDNEFYVYCHGCKCEV